MGVSRRSSVVVAVALLAALVLAFPMYAQPDKAEVTLSRTCQIGSATVPAGTYQVVFDGNKVSFRHWGKTIAEATGEWKKADGKVEYTSVRYEENGRITEIRVQGRDTYFVVS